MLFVRRLPSGYVFSRTFDDGSQGLLGRVCACCGSGAGEQADAHMGDRYAVTALALDRLRTTDDTLHWTLAPGQGQSGSDRREGQLQTGNEGSHRGQRAGSGPGHAVVRKIGPLVADQRPGLLGEVV